MSFISCAKCLSPLKKIQNIVLYLINLFIYLGIYFAPAAHYSLFWYNCIWGVLYYVVIVCWRADRRLCKWSEFCTHLEDRMSNLSKGYFYNHAVIHRYEWSTSVLTVINRSGYRHKWRTTTKPWQTENMTNVPDTHTN